VHAVRCRPYLWLNGMTFTPVRRRQPSASGEATTVQRLDAYVSDINEWMSASKLRLNPTKSEVTWLQGARQQMSRVNISDIPTLSTTIKVAESARTPRHS